MQRTVISKAKPFVQGAIIDLYCKTFSKCLTIADLGCSSGPNTLLAMSEIIDAIDSTRRKFGHRSPEFRVILNDLPGNDFNTIFKSIPYFIETLKKEKGDEFGPCFVAGMPGSFYGRLFPNESINFIHSSYSAHFLSQVPPGIENNEGNIYIAATSPPSVDKAYLEQFRSDFSLFLNSRSEEVIPGGRMVITIIGRRSSDPSSKECCHLWELLAQALREMVSQGLIEEAKLASFNLPWYAPSRKEVSASIQEQGSFHLDMLETFDVNWDADDNSQNKNYVFDKIKSGKKVAECIRAVTESMLVNHFGEEIIEDLFQKYSENVGEYLVKEKAKHINLVICMTKKEGKLD
ncbi:hypothetical protein IFM89_015201 [Coptis chinensis]|uniref:Uncharacterized protein n=1 Tax=Coptis chinensis TaxID=261450 RepID=A0A835LHB9_9MAGN|nr:hypothetical protein IFM89_015201 [Coptis chinensis]